jgi:hypothetical protein
MGSPVSGDRYDLAVAAGADERRVRTADDEARLWELVETAWVSLGAEVNLVRRALAAGPVPLENSLRV